MSALVRNDWFSVAPTPATPETMEARDAQREVHAEHAQVVGGGLGWLMFELKGAEQDTVIDINRQFFAVQDDMLDAKLADDDSAETVADLAARYSQVATDLHALTKDVCD